MDQKNVISRFLIKTVNGKPIIESIAAGMDVHGFVVELSGITLMENVRSILSYVYDEFYDFQEGFCAVKRGDNWGFIDIALREIVEPEYRTVNDVRNGFAVICKGSKYGFLRLIGSSHPSVWTNLEYESAYSFSNGRARVKNNGLYGYVGDTYDTKNVIPCQFNEAFDFDPVYPYAVVRINGKYGIIDKTGNVVVAPIFDTYSKNIGTANYNATIGDKHYWLRANGTFEEVNC